MRVTPLEIRQKTFEKNFRGYQTEEVHAFLQTLSQEWERLTDDNKELRIKLEATEREVTKLREVETSLYKTLKTAEDTGASVIEQARTAAALHLRESQLKAEAMLHEAKSKAKDTIEESDERARQIVDEMEDRLRILVESYKKLETSRDDLLADLKRLANETMDKVDRAKNMSKDFNPDQHMAMAKREAKKLAFPNIDFDRKLRPEPVVEKPVVEKEVILHHLTLPVETPQPKKAHKSFFDEIG
jgi:cell division initiation protein